MIHHELELLVTQAGLTPIQALRSATQTAARTIGIDATRGTLEPGKASNICCLTPIRSTTSRTRGRYGRDRGRTITQLTTAGARSKGRRRRRPPQLLVVSCQVVSCISHSAARSSDRPRARAERARCTRPTRRRRAERHATKVAGSVGVTPHSCDAMSRVSSSAPASRRRDRCRRAPARGGR